MTKAIDLIQALKKANVTQIDNQMILNAKPLKIKSFDGKFHEVNKIFILHANMKQVEHMKKAFNVSSTHNYMFELKESFTHDFKTTKHISLLPTTDIEYTY